MRLLLASAGITNDSIKAALVDLLGKPIGDSTALCIPTASYGMRGGGAASAWRFIAGQEPACPMTGLGWKSVGVLELTALPSLEADHWVPAVREADVVLVNGGDPMYLHHWMVASGFAELLPTLSHTVYVGLSAGSMVLTPRIGEDFVEWQPPTGGGDATLGLVDFAVFPHLDHPDLPENTMADAERWAAGMTMPAYAIDDQTAIKVTDEGVEVISEGQWRLFEREAEESMPFVPPDFVVPSSLETPLFRLEPLGPQHNEADYAAWTSSLEHIRGTPGYPDGNWPDDRSLEDNLRDLRRHADDFANRRGFTYTVLDPATADVIGCVYIYPAKGAPQRAAVQSWVRASRAELDVPLWRAVSAWLETSWPFAAVTYDDRPAT